jgi:hypothetical protein
MTISLTTKDSDLFGFSQGSLGMDGEFVVMLQWQEQLQSGQKEILIERDPRVF